MTNQNFTDTLITYSLSLKKSLLALHIENYSTEYFCYNTLDYTWNMWESYIHMYAKQSAHVLMLGINPGPHGMVQTGIPFGSINSVKSYLQIPVKINAINFELHPKRPILGLDTTREEPSGKLLWGAIKALYEKPNDFFKKFFVLNYCPLAFFSNDEKALNITPDKLPKDYRLALESLCSKHLSQYLILFKIKHIFAIGRYSYNTSIRLIKTLDEKVKSRINVHYLTHPSPLNPKHKQFSDKFQALNSLVN